MSICLSFCALFAATCVTAPQVVSGEFAGRRVTFRGVVTSAVHDDLDDGYNWIFLKTGDGTISASSDSASHPLDQLRRLLDAEVELTGIVRPFDDWRAFLGYHILFDKANEGKLAVVKPAPEDPFAATELTDLLEPHRRTVVGTVAARTAREFFLRRGQSLLRVSPVASDGVPPVGARVVVSGFAERRNILPLLDEAFWRTEALDAAPPEDARALAAEDLWFTEDGHGAGSTHRFANLSLNGKAIRLTGRVDAVSRDERTAGSFRLACDGESVLVDLTGFAADAFPAPEAGAVVSVAGLCSAAFDTTSRLVFPRYLGLTLVPRTADDLLVVRRPPFWTAARLVLLLAIVLALSGGLVVWNVTIKVVAMRRGRQLAHEQIRRMQSELKVEERTRLAVELHDALSQTRTGVAFQIDAAGAAAAASADVAPYLDAAGKILDTCRQELNGCLWDLRCRTFEEKDMTEAVERTLAPHVGSAKLAVRFSVPCAKLSEFAIHTVLRIVRELVTNAVKHGRARAIRIAGELHDNTLSFLVADDGAGFDPAATPGPARGHFGLQGVRERLNAFNGTLACESAPGGGAKFTVVLNNVALEVE